MSPRIWRLTAILALTLVSACMGTPLPRQNAVPAADVDRVSVSGIPNARFLPTDIASIELLRNRLNQREQAYYASLGRPLPPEYLLAISGGGDDGAFAAGLLVGWAERGTRPPFKIVSGISAGALIAPFVFLDDDQKLTQITATISQGNVYTKRPLLQGFGSDALSDNTPLKDLIATYLDEGVVQRIAEQSRHGRVLIVVTTDLDAGVPVIWDIGAIAESGNPESVALIRQILLASASVPAELPPVMFDVMVDGKHYQEMDVDGGASMQTFLTPIGLHLLTKSRPVIAYVIRNARLYPDWKQVDRSTLQVAVRAVSTLISNSGMGDIYRTYLEARRDGVQFNLAYIGNDFQVPHPAEFDHTYIVKLFDYARAKGRAGYAWSTAPPGY